MVRAHGKFTTVVDSSGSPQSIWGRQNRSDKLRARAPTKALDQHIVV